MALIDRVQKLVQHVDADGRHWVPLREVSRIVEDADIIIEKGIAAVTELLLQQERDRHGNARD